MKKPTPTELYASHSAWVEGYAQRWAKKRGVFGAGAEDYVAVALLALWESTELHPGGARFHAFMAQRVFWSMQREWARMDSRRGRTVALAIENAAGERMEIRELARVDRGLERAEQAEELARVLAKIPPRHRRMVELIFVDGRTMSDVGAEFGYSKQRVCQILQKYNISVRG